MDYGIERDQALALVKGHIVNQNLVNHSLAAEAVMRHIAAHLDEDVEKWGLAGLLHDLDVELEPDLSMHTKKTVEILTAKGVDAEIIEAIRLHNLEAHPGEKRSIPFHHALAAGETVTGLVIAAALVRPDKKLGSVKAKSVKKRFKEKAFARGANREIIAECEELGIAVPEFCEMSLTAMQGIADQLGL
jgi:putative nucleotidyltransferase with HDIG domain